MNFPYSDDYMIYDYDRHRYILTVKDVTEHLGITDFVSNARDENEIPAFLRHVSNHIYHYIHGFNPNTELQDYIIAKTEKGRKVIKEAMEEQLEYMLMNGDLSKNIDLNIRKVATDMEAGEVLLETIPEIGSPICYPGRIRIMPNATFDDSEY